MSPVCDVCMTDKDLVRDWVGTPGTFTAGYWRYTCRRCNAAQAAMHNRKVVRARRTRVVRTALQVVLALAAAIGGAVVHGVCF